MLEKLFNSLVTRFAIYFVFNNQAKYVLNGNSPLKMIGYVMGSFAQGRHPKAGWAVYFSSKATKRNFQIHNNHFNFTGDDITDLLISDLDAVDERWQHFKGVELKFENFETKKEIKILSNALSNIDIKSYVHTYKKPPQEDFHSVLDDIFRE